MFFEKDIIKVSYVEYLKSKRANTSFTFIVYEAI
jgi:hypothetical protein